MLMKKSLVMAALVGVALASCTSDDFVGENNVNGQSALTDGITFGGTSGNLTRATATGADAATLLGGEFRVLGTSTKGTTTKIEFDNYIVKWDEANIGSTTDLTNVWGWTYLGTGTQQLKYWNFGQDQYDFVAFSGYDPTDRITTTSSNTLKNINATTVQNLFVSDRVQATIAGGGAGVVKYGEKVGLKFKRLASRVRVGFYETIPGYAVTNVRFYYGADALSSDVSKAKTTVALGANVPVSGNYTVKYDANNEVTTAIEKVGSTFASALEMGTLDYTTAKAADGTNYLKADGTADATGEAVFLGTTSTEATWAKKDAVLDGVATPNSAWQTVLPNQTNGMEMEEVPSQPGVMRMVGNLVLRADFDLVPLDGGSIIHVYNASAVIPATWAAWKPNTAYTYLFKISDQTNGHTTPPGVDPDRDTDGDGIPDVDDDDDDNDGIPDVDDPDDDNDGIPDTDDPDHPDNIPDTVPDPDTPNPDYPTDIALTPIVFDAEVLSYEDNTQETITGLTELGGNAITTYSPESNAVNAAEYKVGETITLASVSRGQWKVVHTPTETTEKAVADNNTYSYTELTTVEAGKTIDQSVTSVYGTEFQATQAGYYIVWLRYLPITMHGTAADVDANYIDVFKVIKVHE